MKELPLGMSSSASRRTVLVGLAASATALIVPRSAGAAGELNVLAWCDHADPRLIQPFEQAQGVKVNVKTYEGTDDMHLLILGQTITGIPAFA